MAEQGGEKRAPRRRYSRSYEMQQQLKRSLLLLRYIEESLTMGQLLELLDDMAKEIKINNWEEVCKTEVMKVLQSVPKDKRVWVPKGRKAGEPIDAFGIGSTPAGEEIWKLRDVEARAVAVLEHIRKNVDQGRYAFHNRRLGVDDYDTVVKPLLAIVAPGDVDVSREEIKRGKELRTTPMEGDNVTVLAALPAIILDDFLRTKGWQYLKSCSVCKKQFIPRRLDAVTCSPRCRKRRSLDKE